jgi:hypothetical protein
MHQLYAIKHNVPDTLQWYYNTLQDPYFIQMSLLLGGYSKQRLNVMLNQYPTLEYLRSHAQQIQSLVFLPVFNPKPDKDFKDAFEGFYIQCKTMEDPNDLPDYDYWFYNVFAPALKAQNGWLA